MIIIGAGLSGLLAATQFQSATVYEASPQGQTSHRALLRFRSGAVGDAVGIEFRKVRVHKGIWFHGAYQPPDILLANLYSLKVLNRLGDRSIWNLDPVDRYIAPEDLMEQLVERVGKRIAWSTPFELSALDDGEHREGKRRPDPIISSMPMSRLVSGLKLKDHPNFNYMPIHVSRFRVAEADVHQTVYFPCPSTAVYRASITGDVLIIESMDIVGAKELGEVLDAFGISQVSEPLGASKQSYGKIAPIDDAWRRKFIAESTRRLNVYALGRFAVWKNILADDVLKDIAVIKRLLKGDAYAARLAS